METRNGQCRCGQIAFQIRNSPLITMACHCTGCQQMTSSAFSLSELYPLDAFEITKGEPVIGGLRQQPRHFFCSFCMSWLFTRPDEVGDFVNVRAAMLEGAKTFTPFIESYTDEMLPWARTNATHSFETFPSPDEFPQLIADYENL